MYNINLVPASPTSKIEDKSLTIPEISYQSPEINQQLSQSIKTNQSIEILESPIIKSQEISQEEKFEKLVSSLKQTPYIEKKVKSVMSQFNLNLENTPEKLAASDVESSFNSNPNEEQVFDVWDNKSEINYQKKSPTKQFLMLYKARYSHYPHKQQEIENMKVVNIAKKLCPNTKEKLQRAQNFDESPVKVENNDQQANKKDRQKNDECSTQQNDISNNQKKNQKPKTNNLVMNLLNKGLKEAEGFKNQKSTQLTSQCQQIQNGVSNIETGDIIKQKISFNGGNATATENHNQFMKLITDENKDMLFKEPSKFQGKNQKPDDLIQPFNIFIINEANQ